MHLGIEQADHANITGEGLQSLQNDPSVQCAQDKIEDQIRSESSYGEQPFSLTGDFGNEPFTANGDGRTWWSGALGGNQAFYMVHSAQLHATNTEVLADGTIATTWRVDDQFDYLPDWENNAGRTSASYWAYNLYATVVSPIYHGLLGAKPYPTNAYWDETIPPEEE